MIKSATLLFTVVGAKVVGAVGALVEVGAAVQPVEVQVDCALQ